MTGETPLRPPGGTIKTESSDVGTSSTNDVNPLSTILECERRSFTRAFWGDRAKYALRTIWGPPRGIRISFGEVRFSSTMLIGLIPFLW